MTFVSVQPPADDWPGAPSNHIPVFVGFYAVHADQERQWNRYRTRDHIVHIFHFC
jgi:hypothetical protein